MTSDLTAEPPMDPIPFLRSAREQMTSFGRLHDQLAPDGVLQPDATEKAFDESMSAALTAIVADYRESHRDVRLRLIRYTRSVDGQVSLILDTGLQVPNEDRLVHLTSATSAADRGGLRVVAEVLVAEASA